MPSELSLQATRAAYIGRQLPRLLWYVGHGYIMGRLAEKARERDGQNGRPRARATAPVPDRGRLYRDMASLFRRDLANVEAGVYPLPQDRDGSLLSLLDRSGLFFEDLPRVPFSPSGRRAQRGPQRQHPRPAAPLLPSEFPLPDRRLDDRGLR